MRSRERAGRVLATGIPPQGRASGARDHVMARWSDWLLARRKWVLAAWILIIVAAAPFAARQSEHLTLGGLEVPSSESERASRVARSAFPAVASEPLSVLIVARPHATAVQQRAAVRQVRDELTQRSLATDRARRALVSTARSRSRRITILPLRVPGSAGHAIDVADDLNAAFKVAESHRRPVGIYMVGRAAQAASSNEFAREGVASAERIGIPIVLLILLAVFGSVAAAALPLVVALVSIALAGAAIFFASQAFEISTFVQNVVSMLGLGVGVDYALFMVARYREELADGVPEREAYRTMFRRAGTATVVSGSTLVLALTSTFVINSPVLRAIAAGGVVVVLAAMLASVSLFALLVRLTERRAGRRRRLSRRLTRPPSRRVWVAWATRVTDHPVIACVGAVAVLLALASPLLSIRLGDDTLRQLPQDNPARYAAQLVADVDGPGASAPIIVTGTIRHGGSATA